MDRLVRLEGKTGSAETPIGDLLTVGRGEENRLRLFDESASRRHATLFREKGRVLVEDLGSSNGTKVNGARVTRAVLCDGDEITFGDVRMRFLSSEASDRPTRIEAPRAGAETPPEDGTVEAAVDPAAADPAAGGGAAAVERLRLVCTAAELAAEAVDPDRLAAALVDLLAESLRPDRAAIHLGGGAGLRLAADHPKGTGRPVASRTLLRRVLEGGEAVLVRDARDADVRAAHASLLSSPFRSTLAAPLATVEGTAGLVVLQAEAPDRWTADDLAVLAAVARQGALALRTLSALSVARAEVRRLSPRTSAGGPELLGKAPAMARLTEAADKAAASDATVVIRGETGTGKELVARRLHAKSARSSGPFVAINCAAIVEGLLESEMFGHEKGAFTSADARKDGRIAEAGGGTLFLDEVGELSPALQAKLLRVLSDKTFTRLGGRDVLHMDCRLVAATHRDLPAMVADGRFREDLWYRLAVVTLDCPPLRERGDDVLTLADAFLERIAARLGRRTPTLSADARARLVAHRWPGNVRELENALERAIVLSSGDVLTAADLPFPVALPAGSTAPGTGPISMREAEKRALVAALAHTRGRKGEAAALLGISWPTLNRKIKEYGLD